MVFVESNTDVVHVDSGIIINIVSGSISIPQDRGTGYGTVRTIECLTEYGFELIETAIKQFM